MIKSASPIASCSESKFNNTKFLAFFYSQLQIHGSCQFISSNCTPTPPKSPTPPSHHSSDLAIFVHHKSATHPTPTPRSSASVLKTRDLAALTASMWPHFLGVPGKIHGNDTTKTKGILRSMSWIFFAKHAGNMSMAYRFAILKIERTTYNAFTILSFHMSNHCC